MPKPPKNEAAEFALFMKSFQDQLNADADYFDPETLVETIADLPQRPDVSWLVIVQELPKDAFPAEFIGEEDVTPHLLVVLSPDFPEPIMFEVAEDREEAELMVLQCLTDEQEGEDGDEIEPYRPAALLTNNAQVAFSLGNWLRETGIEVQRETRPEVHTMLNDVLEQFRAESQRQQAMMTPRPVLVGLSADVVREYVTAFNRFMKSSAWEVLMPDKPLFAAWQDADGTRHSLYATAMGDMGESFGLAFFKDWLAYTEQMENSYNQELVVAGLEGFEALNASGESDFAPQDWAYLKELGLLKGRNPQVPSLMRVGLEGTLPTRTPVHVATAIMNVLADRAESRGTRASSLKGEWRGVQISYPGKPRDELRPEELTGTVTLNIAGGPFLAQGLTFSITGPSAELLSKMYPQVLRQIESSKKDSELWRPLPREIERKIPGMEDDEDHFSLVRMDGLRVWRHGQGSTPVTMAQLTRREGLQYQYADIRAEFNPQPCEGFSYKLTGTATGAPDGRFARRIERLLGHLSDGGPILVPPSKPAPNLSLKPAAKSKKR